MPDPFELEYALPDVMQAHYFGNITDEGIDGFLKEFGLGGLGNDIVFDANGKLIEIDGVTVETGNFTQSGTTATPSFLINFSVRESNSTSEPIPSKLKLFKNHQYFHL